jgi:protein-S-isoprenylcysteine O-methyltransferase Ste14
MQLAIGSFISFCWAAWALIWLLASRRVKKTSRREDPASRFWNTAPLWLAALLLSAQRIWPDVLIRRLVPWALPLTLIGIALLLAGLGFAIWARYHIGSNWSGVVTVKQDHALVRSGPYGLVRHPIYTGLLLAIGGTAMTRANAAAIVAVLLVLFAVLRRVAVEEKWMTETFGAAYDDYRASTPALVPFSK